MIDTMAANDGLERGNAAWTRLRAETRAGCEREGCIDMEFPRGWQNRKGIALVPRLTKADCGKVIATCKEKLAGPSVR
jgi:hypothetical protein